MSLLDKAIKEMRSYSDMGVPDGENGQGMGCPAPIPDKHDGKKVVDAYRMNSILRRHARAEEEEMNLTSGQNDGMSGEQYPQDEEPEDGEGMSPDEFQAELTGDEGMGDDMGMEVEVGGEMQQFFTDNPAPSDEEIANYAQERGMDMDQMRQEVYALIQQLLGAEGGEDEVDAGMFGDMEADGDMEVSPDEEMPEPSDEMDGAKMAGTGGEMNSTYPSFDFSSGKEDEMEIDFGKVLKRMKK